MGYAIQHVPSCVKKVIRRENGADDEEGIGGNVSVDASISLTCSKGNEEHGWIQTIVRAWHCSGPWFAVWYRGLSVLQSLLLAVNLPMWSSV